MKREFDFVSIFKQWSEEEGFYSFKTPCSHSNPTKMTIQSEIFDLVNDSLPEEKLTQGDLKFEFLGESILCSYNKKDFWIQYMGTHPVEFLDYNGTEMLTF